jgi:hypothetical protein
VRGAGPTRCTPGIEREELSLNDAATHVLEECRTVVPGMQALFGFHLIAVFSDIFREQLSSLERMLHLVVGVHIAILLTPTRSLYGDPGERRHRSTLLSTTDWSREDRGAWIWSRGLGVGRTLVHLIRSFPCSFHTPLH